MTIKVAVVGASGRMGKLALEIIDGSQDFDLHAAMNSRSELSQMLGADVVFDLTLPEVSEGVVSFAVQNGLKVLVGTSGWSAVKLAKLQSQIGDAPSSAAAVIIPNFSIGSMLATKFAAEAATFFNSMEIVEAHHAGKIDSPSGTAVRTAELMAEARAGLTQPLIPGVGQEARGQVVAGVPIHSIRLAGVSAKQDIHFGGDSEVLTLSHEVSSIRAYIQGIILSLRYTAGAMGLTVGLQAALEGAK